MDNDELLQEADSALDEIRNALSFAESRMRRLMRAGKYDDMLDYWKTTARYRQDSYYEEVNAKFGALSEVDKHKLRKKYDEYTFDREDFDDVCILYKDKMKEMRKNGRKTSLIVGPILTAVMAVIILWIGWNNLVTKFFALCGLGMTIEALCSALFDKIDAGTITRWLIAIIACAAGAIAWTVLIGRPPITLSIILGYTLWVGVAYDMGTNAFTVVSGD